MRIKLNGDALSLYRILYGRQVKRVAKLNSNTIERKSGLGRNLLTKKKQQKVQRDIVNETTVNE